MSGNADVSGVSNFPSIPTSHVKRSLTMERSILPKNVDVSDVSKFPSIPTSHVKRSLTTSMVPTSQVKSSLTTERSILPKNAGVSDVSKFPSIPSPHVQRSSIMRNSQAMRTFMLNNKEYFLKCMNITSDLLSKLFRRDILT